MTGAPLVLVVLGVPFAVWTAWLHRGRWVPWVRWVVDAAADEVRRHRHHTAHRKATRR